jgi:hypothetical protein
VGKTKEERKELGREWMQKGRMRNRQILKREWCGTENNARMGKRHKNTRTSIGVGLRNAAEKEEYSNLHKSWPKRRCEKGRKERNGNVKFEG